MTAVVVGAGIAGLLAGRVLAEAGVPTLVVEAASVPGGRLATRQTPRGAADVGAQFFTIREPRFQRLVDGWLQDGLVVAWSRGFSAGSGPPEDRFPRYIARHGMAALAAALARSLDLRLGARVTAVAADGPRWFINLEDGETLRADGVVVTPPLPATLPVVARVLPDEVRSGLAGVRYRRTLSAVVAVESSLLPPPGAVQRPNERLAFVADNQRKGLATAPLLTIHASPDWSDALWPLADGAALDALIEEARPYFRGAVADAALDRWDFALPDPVLADRFLAVGTLIVAGDAFAGPRVEGAALSGLAAGAHLATALATDRR